MKLVKKILMYSSNSGDLVFDPFLGSGTVAVGAKTEGRHFLGFEIVPEYFSFAHDRLKDSEKMRKKLLKKVRNDTNAEGGN